jgi:hypothetical protein
MISGSCSSSFRDEIHGWVLCSDMEKKLPRIVAGPVNHGSTSIVKEPGKSPGDVSSATGGLNVSRKAVSPFSDFTVSDMVATGRVWRGDVHSASFH